MRRRVARARVATLATIAPDGRPHLVPVTFALDGDTLYTVVDDKPKTTRALARLANIERDERVTVLVHHYEDDWTRLWWARLEGHARFVTDGGELDKTLSALTSRYEPYRHAVPTGTVTAVEIDRWSGWSAS